MQDIAGNSQGLHILNFIIPCSLNITKMTSVGDIFFYFYLFIYIYTFFFFFFFFGGGGS